jgi:hypothetical protein
MIKRTFTCSKKISSSNIATPKTTLIHRLANSYTTLEDAFNCPCSFWYKVLRVGNKNWVSYVVIISIVETWPI